MKSFKILSPIGLSLVLFTTNIKAVSLNDISIISQNKTTTQTIISENLPVNETESTVSDNIPVSVNEISVSDNSENLPANSFEENAEGITSQITVIGGESGTDYIQDPDGTLTVKTSASLVISGNGTDITDERIVLGISDNDATDINVTFNNLVITSTSAPVKIIDNYQKNVTITLEGTNKLIAGNGHAAIEKNSLSDNGKLTIRGNGNLTAKGGDNAAGIGSSRDNNTANITIESGNIDCCGSSGGADIGGGANGDAKEINILGGNINSTGNYGIGAGSGGQTELIYITGGNIKTGKLGTTPKRSFDHNEPLSLNKITGYNPGDIIPFTSVKGAQYYNLKGLTAYDDGCFYLYLPEGATPTSEKRYIVSFNSNCGVKIPDQYVYQSEKVIEPSNLKKNGYILTGWYIKKNGYQYNKWDFDQDTVTSDIILYARWESAYTVDYDSMCEISISSQTVSEGSYLTPPDIPFREGYVFCGWYTTDYFWDDSYKWDFENDTVYESMTLYANWKSGYTVRFDTGCEATVSPQAVEYNNKISKPDDPEREGYIFTGWYVSNLSATDMQQWDFENDTVKKNITLFAGWIKKGSAENPVTDPELTCIVTFISGNEIIYFNIVEKGTLISKPSQDPAMSGYKFVGWVAGNSLWNFNMPVCSNLTLTAKFTEEKKSVEENTRSGMDYIPVTVSSNDTNKIYMVKGQTYSVGSKYWKISIRTGSAIKINKTGKIFAIKKGCALINNGLKKYDIIVADPKIDRSSRKNTLLIGDTAKIKLNLNSGDGKNNTENYPVTWSSDNPKVAIVNNGEVTALAKGKTKITAHVCGKKFKSSVTVTDKRKAPGKFDENNISITLSPMQTITLKYDTSVFKVRNSRWSGDEMEQITKNRKVTGYKNSVISITKNGKITSIGPGTTTITGTDDINRQVTVNIRVESVPSKSVTFINKGNSEKIKFPKVSNKNATSWLSSDSGVATVISSGRKSGIVTGLKCGSSDISCSYKNFNFSTTAYIEDPVIYFDGSKCINNKRVNISVGEIKQLKIDNVYQTINYKSSKPSVAFIDENGYIYARKKGTAKITTKINGKTYKIKLDVT